MSTLEDKADLADLSLVVSEFATLYVMLVLVLDRSGALDRNAFGKALAEMAEDRSPIIRPMSRALVTGEVPSPGRLQ